MKKKNPTKKIITPAAEGEGATHLKTLRFKDVKMIGFEIFPKIGHVCHLIVKY